MDKISERFHLFLLKFNIYLSLFIIGTALLLSSCTWTTLRPHLIASSILDLKGKSFPLESDEFNQEMEKITGRRRHLNNQLMLLKNGEEIFPVILKLINSAQKYIFIDQYAFQGDEVGSKIASALKKRSNEGVEICIVYDYLGSRETSSFFWNDLANHHIKVRPFNPLPWWTIIRFNNRNHRKIVLVDGETGLIGDFGIGKQYEGDGYSEGSWRVSAILIRGPAVSDLEDVFLESWEEAGIGIIKKDLPIPLINILWDIPLSLFAKSGKEQEKPLPCKLESGSAVRVISSTPNWGSTDILEAFLLAFQSAEKTIHITQTYFIPNSRIRNALIDASKRGVDVKIILPGQTDVKLAKSAAEMSYQELLEGGIRLFEREGSMLHTKAMVIDSIWSSLGSCNIDDRSFILNYECNLNVYNEEFGKSMEKMFAEDLEYCKEIILKSWEKRSWWKCFKIKLLTPIIKQL